MAQCASPVNYLNSLVAFGTPLQDDQRKPRRELISNRAAPRRPAAPILFFSLLLSSIFLMGQQQQVLAERVMVDLNDLSNAELEAICTDRGFELVRETDDGTNESYTYTHEDYIDAARQCLQIEEEMEQLLEENPEILQDLEAETKQMMEEKQRLEKELAEAQKQLEKDREAAANKFKSAFITDEGDVPKGTNEKEEEAGGETTEKKSDESTQGKENVIDLDDEVENEKDTVDGTVLSNSSSGNQPHGNKPSSKGGIESSLAMRRLVRETVEEFRERAHKDLRWLADVIFPKSARGPVKKALQPLVRIARDAGISVFDLIRRHLRAIFQTTAAQKHESNGAESDSVEKTEQNATS
uniref:Uncharacterized protein n=1 Tax=Ditylum brightwellii TaxID=49249 RepID=A0A7S2ED33_9STRA